MDHSHSSKKPTGNATLLQNLHSNIRSVPSPQLQHILNPVTIASSPVTPMVSTSTPLHFINTPASLSSKSRHNEDDDDEDDDDWEVVDQDEDETEDENGASSCLSSADDEDYEPETHHEEAQEDVDFSFYQADADYNELEGDDLEKLLEDLKHDFDSSLLDLLKPVGYNLPQEIIAQQGQNEMKQVNQAAKNGHTTEQVDEDATLATIDPQIVQSTRDERESAQQTRLKALINYPSAHFIPTQSSQSSSQTVGASRTAITTATAAPQNLQHKVLPLKSATITPQPHTPHGKLPLPPLATFKQMVSTGMQTMPITSDTLLSSSTDSKPTPRTPHNAGTTSNDIGIVESCEFCLRQFRGPKARTHRQQHIKKLHPDSYTRKKSGRKSGTRMNSKSLQKQSETVRNA
ncbi:hypothetical protein WICPIJ_001662 [Wickerhamomyces pijperi]|uniref:Uncharacterized protein n=1 Tax=Wickerhamomyces pijperi TaxID=599730 RepID=A0A9P8QD74_WICPI|nr:hypothetical protein WICPIJ_001662 [Wickerhamomyces pijperi]